MQELETTVRPGCHFCSDFAAIFSDISAGAVGSPQGYTTLIVRNDVGQIFLESALKNGKLVTGPDPDIAAIERLASKKENRTTS